jgi:hypothetical protein
LIWDLLLAGGSFAQSVVTRCGLSRRGDMPVTLAAHPPGGGASTREGFFLQK